MTPVKSNPTRTPQDRDFDRESFFVAVCDCDASSFIAGFGRVHPYHVAPASTFQIDDLEGGARA